MIGNDGYFSSETGDFQPWVMAELSSFGHHVQPITGDPKYPGIPDLSIGMPKMEVWAEAKLYKRLHGIYDVLRDVQRKERELTAQQRDWLKQRQRRGNSSCGVLIGWRTLYNIKYVSFIPIDKWDEVLGWDLATLALSKHTETLNRIFDGKTTLHDLIITSST